MDSIKTPLLLEGRIGDKRNEIREYFNRTYRLYELLFECLANERAFYERPEALRHPLIFYFGHTAVFYVNKLNEAELISGGIDPELEAMLAIGVDEMSWDDLNEDHYDWPSLRRLREYRAQVKELINQFIDTASLEIPICWDDPFWIVMMGIEHERIHLETSSVLIRQLDLKLVREHSRWPICPVRGRRYAENVIVPYPGGSISMGRSHPAPTYGWDNEFSIQRAKVAPFSVSKFLVSNEEYLGFVDDGGYERENYWSNEGWQWRSFKQAICPPFWIPRATSSSKYVFRSLTTEIDMPFNWPVEVNFHEANAYCQWISEISAKKLRLPTEAEWLYLYESSIREDYPMRTDTLGNLNLELYASSCPVDTFQQGDLFDLIGNVWQWTSTPIAPFDGFRPHAVYDDFSVPTFDGRHNVIKGGSWISTGNEARYDSRYAFRRHFYQHAGFRFAESMVDTEEE